MARGMKKGQAASVINSIILELEKYAMVHYQKEEFFFKKFNYPKTKEHILSTKVLQIKSLHLSMI